MQTETTYTQGPWRIAETITLDGCALILSDHSKYGTIQLARIPDYSPDSSEHANARLIAAAPEMLEALKAIESCLSPDDNDYAAQKVRAAIRRAA